MQSPNHFGFKSAFTFSSTGLPPPTSRVINTRRRSLQKTVVKTNPPVREVDINKPKVQLPSLRELIMEINRANTVWEVPPPQNNPFALRPVKLIPIDHPKDSLQPEAYVLKFINPSRDNAERSREGSERSRDNVLHSHNDMNVEEGFVKDPFGNPVTLKFNDIEKMTMGMFNNLINTLGDSPKAKKMIENICINVLNSLKKSE